MWRYGITVESSVLADRVAVPRLVAAFVGDVTCFCSSEMFCFVWCAVYRVCVCLWGVVCSI